MADARDVTTAAKVAFLKQPEAYAQRPSRVETIETHMSWLFLTDRFVYKMKKPVRTANLDYSTLGLRRRNCDVEVRLNRRLSPHVYLGSVALTMDAAGELSLSGPGKPVEWLVHMRRLPARDMLDQRVAAASASASAVEPAAHLLAQFYAHAVAVDWSARTYLERLRVDINASADELAKTDYGLPARLVADVQSQLLARLRRLGDALARRADGGHIVEGHGDLRPEHICLCSPPAIIDCLEFRRSLRLLDPLDELSFLALELERLDAADVADWFFSPYRAITGDRPVPELIVFYKSYRALLRAKVAVWHNHDVTDLTPWIRKAVDYLQRARTQLSTGR